MSITFSYNDGGRLARAIHEPARRASLRLAAVFPARRSVRSDKQRYQDAANVYRALRGPRSPTATTAPDLDMAAIEAYGKGGFSQLVVDGKHEFVERYNFDSPYWKTRSRADNARVVQELKTNLKDVATYFHASRAEVQTGPRTTRKPRAGTGAT